MIKRCVAALVLVLTGCVATLGEKPVEVLVPVMAKCVPDDLVHGRPELLDPRRLGELDDATLVTELFENYLRAYGRAQVVEPIIAKCAGVEL